MILGGIMKKEKRNEDEEVKASVVDKYRQVLKYLIRTTRPELKAAKREKNIKLSESLRKSIIERIFLLAQALKDSKSFFTKNTISVGSIVYIKYESSVGKMIPRNFFIPHDIDESLSKIELGDGIIPILSDSSIALDFIGKKINDEISIIFNGYKVTGKIINVF